ncbi:MBL fold metallo-hydrolase [Litorimonas sp. RW-G-Af-16]|uniref:MBL fold metallo-hydrolase n=1 Tax=Litorimonas sp. RW-G-Af-16 TaxID=3241168 RepID=UPI00390C4FEB
MGIRAIILGCGSSGGVPRVGGDWGACDPNEPKNRRSRSSILVQAWQGKECPDDQSEMTTILIDSSPDLREQLLRAETQHLDALLYTHDHADQSHGIDDLRAIAYRMRKQVPTYMDAHTKEHVWTRFQYCFEMPEGRVHPPILDLQPLIKNNDVITVSGAGGDISVKVLEVSHGPTPSLGFVFNDLLAYSPDVWGINTAALETLRGMNTWIVDALRYNDHPTHAHADKTLAWIAKTQTRQAVLTNLHIDMDYQTLSEELPPAAKPAFDGMIVEPL